MSALRNLYLKLLVGGCLLISGLFYFGYGIEGYNFYGDALGYYMYLPNTFIYHNHKSVETLPQDRGIRPFIHAYAAQMGGGQRGAKGYVINQYTYGVALLEAPFFLAAHAFEKVRGSEANGFSESYRNTIDLSAFVYGLLGLWLCYRLLRRRFSVNIAATTVALLLIGTNLFWFLLRQQGMAHVPLFFLFALLLHLTVHIHQSGRWRDFAALGLVAGLITVIRPVDGLCVLIPVLYAKGRPYLSAWIRFARVHWLKIALAACCFALPVIPQLLYWKWLTGYFLYDSYGPGQGFDFRHPALRTGLFSASNGWLFYTPLMVFAIIGILRQRRLMGFGLAIPVVLLLYIWAVYAWFLPTYINGFGSRPMVDLYAMLAVPLAAALEWLHRRKPALRAVGALVVLFFVAWNLSGSVQQAKGTLISQDSKYRFNFQTAFRSRLRYEDLVVWDIGLPQPAAAELKTLGEPHCLQLPDSVITAGRYVVAEGEEYPPLRLRLPVGALAAGTSWIEASGMFRTRAVVDDIYAQQMLVMQFRRGDSVLKWYGVRINNKIGLLEGNEPPGGPVLGQGRAHISGAVRFLMPVPQDLRPDDELLLDVWNIARKPMEISGLCLQGMVRR